MADIRKDHQRLLDNLKLIQHNFSLDELSALLGISKTTWIARMKEPWRKFSYDDFKAISTYCKVDFAQLMEGTLKIK